MTKSKFDAWFVQQHGKRPSRELMLDLLKRQSDTQYAADRAFILTRDCQRWDAQYKSASYAWNIKDKDK